MSCLISSYRGKIYPIIIGFIVLFSLSPLKAQEKDSLEINHTILPLLFYLPETSLGLGATGITTYKKSNHHKDTRSSQILYSAVYTLKNQILLYIPFTIWGNDNSTRIKGEIGYYKYFYNYYGIGGQSASANLENYDVVFPRIELSYAKRIKPHFYVGLGLQFDKFQITEIKPDGLIAVQQPSGWQGGQKANVQALVIMDTRDHIFAASKGYYLELALQKNLPDFISDFNYFKTSLLFKKYFALNEKTVIASQISFTRASSSAPFFDLPYLSTPARSRGFSDRRYLNPTLLALDTELRFRVIKKLRAAAFIGLAQVPASTWSWFDAGPKFSYGLGLRYELNKEDKIRLRLDIARGGESTNIYFTVNEAF